MGEDEENIIEKEDKKLKDNLKKISNFLIDFDKTFKLEPWGSGEGYDFIIEENEIDTDYKDHKYRQVISITLGGFLQFDKQEQENAE